MTTLQIAAFLDKFENIAIVPNVNSGSDDNIMAALALQKIFKYLRKESSVIIDDFFAWPKFVKEVPLIILSPKIDDEEFCLKIDAKDSGLEQIRYENNSGVLSIFIKTKNNNLSWGNVAVSSMTKPQTLVFLGYKNLEQNTDFYKNNSNLLFNIPIVNIDITAENKYFGAANLVDVTRSSVSEIIFDYLESLNLAKNPELATYLLAGIMSATEGLKSPRVSSELLDKTSRLMNEGALHQEIILHYFKTKPLSQLKLMAQIITNLKPIEQSPVLSGSVEAVSEQLMFKAVKDVFAQIGSDKILVLVNKNQTNLNKNQIIIAFFPHFNSVVESFKNKIVESTINQAVYGRLIMYSGLSSLSLEEVEFEIKQNASLKN